MMTKKEVKIRLIIGEIARALLFVLAVFACAHLYGLQMEFIRSKNNILWTIASYIIFFSVIFFLLWSVIFISNLLSGTQCPYCKRGFCETFRRNAKEKFLTTGKCGHCQKEIFNVDEEQNGKAKKQ